MRKIYRKTVTFGVSSFLLFALFINVQTVFATRRHEIATVVKITGIPWFNRLEEGVKRAEKELKLKSYQVGPADADPAQQVKIVEDLIIKGVDAICITPNDAKALEPAFAKAKAKGIAIITHESPEQKGKNYDVELIDNVKFARHFWDMLVKYMGNRGEYAIFVGSLTVPLHNLWADIGLKYAKTKYPDLKLVTQRIPCGEDQALSKQTMLGLLKTYPKIKGIIGFGSLGPLGAAQALKEKGLAGKVTVVGTVLPDHAAPYLREGSMQHGILWDPKDAGFAMTWIAKQVIEGKKITQGMTIPGLGKISLNGDVIKVDAVIDITKDNVGSFGF
jgi:simple sugar transport system substrate-binding protein